MKSVQHSERRKYDRFPQRLEVELRELPDLDSPEGTTHVLHGHVQNISDGGICLVTAIPMKQFAMFRCQIPIGDVHPHVATLMRVRWTQRNTVRDGTYITGLENLL